MDRVVVESPVSDDVPVVELDMFPDTSQFALLNPQGSQMLHLSSVQLSPNRVCLDFDLDTIDVFPVFAASPRFVYAGFCCWMNLNSVVHISNCIRLNFNFENQPA